MESQETNIGNDVSALSYESRKTRHQQTRINLISFKAIVHFT